MKLEVFDYLAFGGTPLPCVINTSWGNVIFVWENAGCDHVSHRDWSTPTPDMPTDDDTRYKIHF